MKPYPEIPKPTAAIALSLLLAALTSTALAQPSATSEQQKAKDEEVLQLEKFTVTTG